MYRLFALAALTFLGACRGTDMRGGSGLVAQSSPAPENCPGGKGGFGLTCWVGPEGIGPGCNLRVSPESLPAGGGSVNAVLQVLGTAAVKRTTIGDVDLASTVGGSRVLDVRSDTVLVARVEGVDGLVAQCTAEVKVSAGAPNGVCKDAADAGDYAALSAKGAEVKPANDGAKAAALSAAKTADGLGAEFPLQEKKGMNLAQFDDPALCKLLDPSKPSFATCVSGEKVVDGNVTSVRVNVDGKIFEVFSIYERGKIPGEIQSKLEILAFQASSAAALPVVLGVAESPEILDVPLTLCECDTRRYSSAAVAGDSLAPGGIGADTREMYWLSVGTATSAAADLKARKLKRIAFPQRYPRFATKYVPPPPGHPKPPCPMVNAT